MRSVFTLCLMLSLVSALPAWAEEEAPPSPTQKERNTIRPATIRPHRCDFASLRPWPISSQYELQTLATKLLCPSGRAFPHTLPRWQNINLWLTQPHGLQIGTLMTFTYTTAVTLAALFIYTIVFAMTGWARGKYKIQAPAVSGHPVFERTYRVQMNTLEGLILFLPALWILAYYSSDKIAASLGLIWVIGRIFYTLGYINEAKKRALGAAISILTQNIILIAAIVSFIMSLFHAS